MKNDKCGGLFFKTILFLTAAFVFFGIKEAHSCATVDEYVIKTSEDRGAFEMPRKYFNLPQLDFYRDRYHGKIEAYFDNEKLKELEGFPDGVSFSMREYFPQSQVNGRYSLNGWLPKTVSVRILQDGKEFYSAKWKIYDNNRNKYLLNFVSPFIILFLTAVTFFVIIWAILSNSIVALEKWRIKAWIFIPLLILDIIVIMIYVSSQSLLC